MQTSVVNSNLNPVWNEELLLSIPHDYSPVKLVILVVFIVIIPYSRNRGVYDHQNIANLMRKTQQVFDQDTFSADDIMGEADIDMQPMINSAMAFGDAKKFSDMQIGKWLKSYDNALIEDSPVNIVAGKVRQELWLRLQNVESGEVELELEWLPL